MKVGTDAVLLGAWVKCGQSRNVLDIGCGSGILSLMIAQRCNASFLGIDIDCDSVEEAAFNFSASRWAGSMQARQTDLLSFSNNNQETFDLIVSNPPFFTDAVKGTHHRRNLARHTDSLSFDDMIRSVCKLLSADGTFCLVLPFQESKVFVDLASIHGLTVSQKLTINPVENKAPNRVNLALTRHAPDVVDEQQLTVRKINGEFTSAYFQQLRDYYLGF
ncbi:MAG: methyltransferase [Bacteroidales bacterium]|nr:methyltransferase [Bacteroidales bacterium]